MANTSLKQDIYPLDLQTKLAYGIGTLGVEILASILVFFFLFFLSNVAGLNPGLAGGVLLVGRAWDSISDPMVGWLSDRTRTPLGARYPWMLAAALPLGILYFLNWVVPPIAHQWGLFAYYSGIALLLFTAFTAVAIPLKTLAAELTQTYDQRTSLISFQGSFGIIGSILGLVLAQLIFSQVQSTVLQYQIVGAVCGGLATICVVLCVWGTYHRYQMMQQHRPKAESRPAFPLSQQLRLIVRNRPYLYVMAIYLCSWLSLQGAAAILPYFVVNWMGLPENHFTQMALVIQASALLMMFPWSQLALRFSKKVIYCWGIPLTVAAQFGLFALQPQQVGLMYGLAAIAGIGISTAYLVPWSMLPDVIDLNELNTGQRQEGIFYSFIVQFQKMGTACAIFCVGQILDWSGFIPSVADQPAPVQPASALWAIRGLVALPGFVLIGGVIAAFFYPITREVHEEILLKMRHRDTQHNQAS